uniref:Carboxylic ester hydrolase n=1 Tax=Meloidogyne javanica TaxID=6303 RepID=A0A915MFV0_MELJA
MTRLENCSVPSKGSDNSPIACTESGIVRGAKGNSFPNVLFFKGIPYAAPPVGDRRWKEPTPAENWHGVKNATNWGQLCTQTVNQDSKKVIGSEDCLFLNIFTTPDSIGTKAVLKPVYIWIHGGALSFGSSAVGGWDGEAMASKGIIFVSINYRLGLLGFFTHPALREENPKLHGNYGLLDQIFAIKWVKNNIANFGGDPERITIGGQSAGIFSSGAFYPDDPINWWMTPYTVQEAENVSLSHLESVNVNRDITVDKLRDVTVEQLYQQTWKLRRWRQILDGYVIPLPFKKIMNEGLQNKVHVLMGFNYDEFGASPSNNVTLEQYKRSAANNYKSLANEFMELYPANDDSSATTATNNAIREYSIITQNMWGQLWLKNSKKCLYQYLWKHPLPGNENTVGTDHGAETAYFLNTVSKKSGEKELELADKMSSYIVNFVKKYNPNGGQLPKWPKQNCKKDIVMSLGDSFGEIPLAANNLDKKIDFIKRNFALKNIL